MILNQASGSGNVPVSAKSWKICFWLCLLFGMLGLHRFYAGKTKSGIAYMLTMGFFGLGILSDLFLLFLGRFKDAAGRRIIRLK